MASRLDQALDEVIKDRRGNSNNSKRSNNFGRNTRRDNGSGSGGAIRKRVGGGNSSPAIRSFVRTVNVMEERVSHMSGLIHSVLIRTRCC